MSQLMRGQSQLDEGFSEETRSQADSDMMYSAIDMSDADASTQKVLQSLLALPAEQREYIIAEGVNTLGSLAKGRIGKHIVELTHFDPALYLPNEVFLQVFSYLSPHDLLTASTISRDWRVRSQDERLWRLCFAREGWVLDKAKMEAFEEFVQKKGKQIADNLTHKPVPQLERRESRKRKTEDAFSGDEGPIGKARVETGESSTSAPSPGETNTASDGTSLDSAQDRMEGVEAGADSPSDNTAAQSAAPSSGELTQAYLQQARAVKTPPISTDFQLQPQMFQPGRDDDKLSWPYLYKQRRRLESNWEKGFYTMFQLPHRDYPTEGHAECVYTIQHTTRHLVSGSRDKTIRVWDLSTNRLKGKPLRGHDASVLCLQFDDRPEHDIIVSGGSDAYVIIWRFSTGEIIKKMTEAHGESVLNLRFDDRYIVTCSKDKTIKIWNRHALQRDSPLIPQHVLHNFNDPTLVNLASPIEEYSLLHTFIGHHAAVNAVMIHDTTIVSASGDRTIKAWDLHTGHHKKSYNGHQKGIACVQFDGRRIVSGSSDNTVRIFDAQQQAEIACLAGHTNLVRTVQARFGDLETTTDEELLAEAREADRKFYKALAKGMQPATASRRGPRNAGSSRPEDMQSVGTKIPPGGGGSRWAKIVSGSYDETVIVWKRDSEGKWQVKLRLHQDQLLRANRAHRRREHFAAAGHTLGNNAAQPNGAVNANGGPANQPHQILNAAQGHLQQVQTLLQHQNQLDGAAPAQPVHLPAMANAQSNLNNQLNRPPQHQTTITTTTAGPTTTFTATTPQTHQQHHQHPTPAQAQAQAAVQAHAANPNIHPNVAHLFPPQPPNPNGTSHVQHFPPAAPTHPHSLPPHLLAQLNQVNQQHTQQLIAAHQQQAQQPNPNPNQPAAGLQVAQADLDSLPNGTRAPTESNRVFKLQFDARRIVCCSQNRTIVGWDFANGDEELERIGEWSLETA